MTKDELPQLVAVLRIETVLPARDGPVPEFYRKEGEEVVLSPDERVVIARWRGGIVGAVRICREEGVWCCGRCW